MKRPFLFLALATLVGAGCVHTGINSTEGWNKVQSRHFNLYTVTTQLHTAALNHLEVQWATLANSFFRGTDLPKVDVLFLEGGDFDELMGMRREAAAFPHVPGGGAIGKQGLIIIQPTPGVQNAEALAHLYIHKAFPKAPLWFHEGFASYARNGEYKEGGGQRIVCFGKPSIGRDETFMPLSKLITMSWDDYDGDEARGWYKHSAQMLIDYTMYADKGSHTDSLERIVDGIRKGESNEEIFKSAFPDMTMATLEKKVIDHGHDVIYQAESNGQLRGMCPIPFQVAADREPDMGERQMSPASAADITALLDGIRKLPRRDEGYPLWYPEEVVARAEAGAAKP